jgi:hypothetical protein
VEDTGLISGGNLDRAEHRHLIAVLDALADLRGALSRPDHIRQP